MMMKSKMLLFFMLLIAKISFAQESTDPAFWIEKVNTKFLKVRDYQANGLIDARISFLKILPQRTIIYFRQPDQFHLKSKGIAILPKQRFDNLFSILVKKDSYNAFPGGTEVINNHPTIIINVIPTADTSDLVLAKIWIDKTRGLVLKAQLTTKSNGTILVEYDYQKHIDFSLPDKITFTVELKKFKIPKAIAADINSETKPKSADGKEPKTGKIIVTLSDYIINKGLPDSVFKK